MKLRDATVLLISKRVIACVDMNPERDILPQ